MELLKHVWQVCWESLMENAILPHSEHQLKVSGSSLPGRQRLFCLVCLFSPFLRGFSLADMHQGEM